MNKGEKAIRILAPAPYKIKEECDKIDPVTQEIMLDRDGNPQKEEVEITIPAFRAVSVFDVSQTDGKPIPQLEAKELLSDVKGYQDMIHAVEAVSQVSIDMEEIAGESKGYFDQEARRIAVQENMSESQTLKTMIHEVAHSMLHNKEVEQDEQARKDRNTKEVEAESIAYTVCQHFGVFFRIHCRMEQWQGYKGIGVESQFLVENEFQHEEITKLIVTKDMSERKNKMIELGNAFIAFPGGTGTLEEISEMYH